MPHPVRRHLSFANITSLCALVFAMGGTSYALTVAKNSVGSAQIKKGAVANSDLRANAVTAAKVKNGSLLAADFALNQLPRGATGATGLPGAPGATGPIGPQGPAGLLSGTIVRRTDVPLPAGAGVGVPGAITSGFATCAPGEKIVGGSANVSDIPTPPTMEILGSRPSENDVGNGTVPADGDAYAFWKGTARTLTNVAGGAMRVFAICAVP